MGKYLRGMLLVLLAVVFIGSGSLVLRQMHDYSTAEQANEQAREISAAEDLPQEPVELPEPMVPLAPAPVEEDPFSKEPLEESLSFLLETDLDELRQTNPDVLGWIHIPDSELNYPLLQGEDNQTYLNRAWDGTRNSAGSIYLECKSSPDFSDFNTIIYGHRMNNTTMFGSLRNYKDQEYLDSHPYVYVVMDDEVRRYAIFSAYMAPVVSNTYRLYVEEEEIKQVVLDHGMTSSVLDSEVVPTVEDQIITLSTCTDTGNYDYRWVVQAVLDTRWKR